MSSLQADVVIVGAGPIGLTAARAASQQGARVLVLEQRADPGASSSCTGLVSPRTLPTLDTSERSVLRRIFAVTVHFPGGKTISLRSQQAKALVIRRELLEQELLERAVETGVQVLFDHRAVSATRGSITVKHRTKSHVVHGTMVVGSDGPFSRVARWFGLSPPPAIVHTAQAELACRPLGAPDSVDIFLGQSTAPGFFAWSVPAEDGVLRVGVGVLPPHRPAPYLDGLVQRFFPSARSTSRTAGWIPVAPASRIVAPGLLLVGDSAGQTKPLSGGGLYTGGLCARAAGETAAAIVGSSETEAALRAKYVARCRDAIGREQAFGVAVRHFVSDLQDDAADRIASSLEDASLLGFLAEHADIDAFHRLADGLAAKPHLWSTLLALVPLVHPQPELLPATDIPRV